MRARLLVPVAAALVVIAAGWALLGADPGRDERYVSEHPVAVPEAPRTVMVSVTMPPPSIHARRLSAMLDVGAMPAGRIMAEVLTDTDCAPDEHMISRCRNEVRLADGRTIVLRHPHDMRSVPCLAPAEHVLLVPTST